MKRITIGNSVNIPIGNVIIATNKIEITGTINSSFNFVIKQGDKVMLTVTFPLSNQTLNAGDYLDNSGIYRTASDSYEDYTDDQLIAFQDMNNINISKSGSNISLSNSNAILKLYYAKADEEDEQIYVLDKNEVLITVFNKDDEDPIYNPRITDTQNSESVFTFNIDVKTQNGKR